MNRSFIKFIIFLALAALAAMFCGRIVYETDPFFHYRAPLTDTYFYRMDSPKNQNIGIVKHFQYDALITGSSMSSNFKTSEMDELFGTHSVKIPFPGTSFKEINDTVELAIKSQPDLRIVVRAIDSWGFSDGKDMMRDELGTYPLYLYDDNRFNDIQYLCNRDVLFGRALPMITDKYKEGEDYKTGRTSFDDYMNWMRNERFGVHSVAPNGISPITPGQPQIVYQKDKERALENIHQNLTDVAEENPDVTFYYFISPFSIMGQYEPVIEGSIYRSIELERLAIREMLKYDNIKLYSFNTMTEITTDLNNYKDRFHYGEWINTLILRFMKEDRGRITKENYEAYLDEELQLYLNYDYESLNDQNDYENDNDARYILDMYD